MISKYALVLANYFAGKGVYDAKSISTYKYGFELLISTVLNFIGIAIISICMGNVIGVVLFCIAFIPIRLAAGGYHAKHHWSCILGFNITVTIVLVIQRYLGAEYRLIYSLIAIMISSLSIWTFAPVEAVNKPLKESHREKQRNKSIVIACSNLGILLVFFALPQAGAYSQFLAFYCSGAFAAGLFLGIAAVLNECTRTAAAPKNL